MGDELILESILQDLLNQSRITTPTPIKNLACYPHFFPDSTLPTEKAMGFIDHFHQARDALNNGHFLVVLDACNALAKEIMPNPQWNLDSLREALTNIMFAFDKVQAHLRVQDIATLLAKLELLKKDSTLPQSAPPAMTTGKAEASMPSKLGVVITVDPTSNGVRQANIAIIRHEPAGRFSVCSKFGG